MRILQVSTSDRGGGAEGSAYNLFAEYRRRGLQSWLAVGERHGSEEGVLRIPNEERRSRWSRFFRLTCQRVPGPSYLPKLLRKLAWLAETRRLVEHQLGIEDFHYPGSWDLLSLPPRRPTILHCHNLHGRYFDLRALPFLSAQLPVILNLRDAWLLAGHCAHSFGCERWRTGCGRCPDLGIHPAIKRDSTAYNWRRKRNIYARSRLYITAPSRWLIAQQEGSMLQSAKSRVIPNSIDLGVFKPGDQRAARRGLNLPQDTRTVLSIAHNTFKDLGTMEGAMARVSTQCREPLLTLCLGRHASHEKPLGAGSIRYLPFERDCQRMAMYYQAADVFLQASFGEAFGKTVAEAMACGTPVVATAVGGIPELFTHSVDGFLVEARNALEMAHFTEVLLDDGPLRLRMGQSAAAHAKERFALGTQADHFLEWYQEVIEDWNSKAPRAKLDRQSSLLPSG